MSEISNAVEKRFETLGCRVIFCQCDVLHGFQQIPPVDAAWVNLFLHHFDAAQLKELLAQVAARCQVFIACEPRRGAFPLLASRCLALLGCNDVTRHDAVISVQAGFDRDELSTVWPNARDWSMSEGCAGMFSHLFVARRL
jgi:hypothetical protein